MDKTLSALHGLGGGTWLHLGALQAAYERALAELEELQAAERIWGRDGSLWSDDADVAEEAEDRLGWLDLGDSMRGDLSELQALQRQAQAMGIRHVVLIGMGGSSLAPEVLRHILGLGPGGAELIVLDTTDPAHIRHVDARTDPAHTLYLASSKSGTTIETLSLMAHYKTRLEAVMGTHWPRHLVAITDPRTRLDTLASEQGFFAVLRNPPDIGGRYSALSLFGLAPAALMGLDMEALLDSGRTMADQCRQMRPADNPGLVLGAVLGALARLDPPRDKLTLLCSPELAPFGSWVEQLVAESTGKEGLGILPVEGEPLRPAAAYGDDRLFVALRLAGADNGALDARVADLARVGQPVLALGWEGPQALGGEFYRWEFATAAAGALLGINPFDQPNVELAKKRAVALLKDYGQGSALPCTEPVLVADGLTVRGPQVVAADAGAYLAGYLEALRPGDYIAIMAYIERSVATEQRLRRLQAALARRWSQASTVGFGPRFLHSTGQLHKGGPDTGLFLQIVQDEGEDLGIPGQSFTFGVLKQAQAAGDLQALLENGRQVAQINLGSDVLGGLDRLNVALERVLAHRR